MNYKASYGVKPWPIWLVVINLTFLKSSVLVCNLNILVIILNFIYM
jgi:hypothetical protein